MNRAFLIVFLILVGSSAWLYWTQPDRVGQVPVLYWTTQNDPTKRETIALFKAWLHDHHLPPVDLRIDNANQDPTKKLAQGLAGVGSDLFDIYTLESDNFANSGMLMDVTGPAKAMGFSPAATYPALYSDLVFGGRQYGFPRNAGGNLCWVNQDTFAKYGIPEPSYRWSWDEFEELGRRLVEAANPPGTRQRVYFIQAVSTMVLRRGLGLSVFNETMTRCILDDPRNTEVMRRLHRWTAELHLIPTLAEQMAMAADTARSGDQWFYLYASGRYAMLFVDRWALIRLREIAKTRSRIVEPFNSGFPNMEFGCGIISAYAGTKHPAEALRFLQFLTSDRFNDLIARSGDSLPPVPRFVHTKAFMHPPDHPEEWALEQVFARAAPEIGIAYSRSPFVLMGTIYRPVTGIDSQVLDEVIAGRLKPEDAGRVEANRINAEIALNVQADAKLRRKYEELLVVQQRIDQLRAEGKKVPAAWITNPFHLAYYRAKGWLEEGPPP